jgi:hypothetical protein
MHLIRKLVITGLSIIAILAMWTLPAYAKSATPAPQWTSVPLCAIHVPPAFTETGFGAQASSIAGVITVECRPVYAEISVTITAAELNNQCHGTLSWYSPTATGGTAPGTGTGESFNVILDNDGNATAVVWGGPSCAAGTHAICASLNTAPFPTVCKNFTILPPRNTAAGVKAIPSTEVEDSTTSSVDTVVYAEFPAIYAERTVQINAQELFARCSGGITWVGADEVVLGTGASVSTTLDNNGNAFVVALAGPSCAPGTSTVEAALVGPPYTSHFTSFTILSPRPTCTSKSCS